ncbi:MAG: hypothetical protein KIT45_13185 [Fimbriimonadia bacterium]|nr:hypothetical protein [Fimbriimonadia bacterium]
MKTIYMAGFLGLIGFNSAAAQERMLPETVQLELYSDFRSRFASEGTSGSQLYNGSFRLKTDVARNWRVEIYGARKWKEEILHQASLEHTFGADKIQVGLVRLPFGLYDHQEVYTSGIIDYPLPRVDYAFNSVDWGVTGAKWEHSGGHWGIEAAAFSGNGSGTWNNTDPVRGVAVRGQLYTGDLIVGFSRWDGDIELVWGQGPYTRRTHINGIDFRWTRPQLIVRGEYLFGTLAAKKMNGFYVDVYYRLPKHERWSLVGRLETYKPKPSVSQAEQLTLGARYMMSKEWVFAINWRVNDGFSDRYMSWTPKTGRAGDIYLQVYRKVVF